MPKTPSKMHMYNMVKTDQMVFEIVGGGLFKPPGSLAVSLKYPGLDRDIFSYKMPDKHTL